MKNYLQSTVALFWYYNEKILMIVEVKLKEMTFSLLLKEHLFNINIIAENEIKKSKFIIKNKDKK